jgi:hypothetical protein
MNRRRDNRGRFTSGRSTPNTTSPTPSCGIVRATPSSNPFAGRTTRGGRIGRIVTTQAKGKGNVGEGSSKTSKIPSTSQQVVILPVESQEEELLSGQPKVEFPENPIEEPELSTTSKDYVHFEYFNMSGVLGDREEGRGYGGREEHEREERQEGTDTSIIENEFGFPNWIQ